MQSDTIVLLGTDEQLPGQEGNVEATKLDFVVDALLSGFCPALEHYTQALNFPFVSYRKFSGSKTTNQFLANLLTYSSTFSFTCESAPERFSLHHFLDTLLWSLRFLPRQAQGEPALRE